MVTHGIPDKITKKNETFKKETRRKKTLQMNVFLFLKHFAMRKKRIMTLLGYL